MSVIPAKKITMPIFALVLILSLATLYFQVIRKGEVMKGVQELQERIKSQADVSFRKFHFIEREEGERKWEIWADRAERFQGEARVHLDQVKIEVLMTGGNVVRLTGQKGDYWEKQQRVVLSGNVMAQNDSGYTLYAKKLDWEAGKGLLSSDDRVRLTTARHVAGGDRMRYWPDREKLEVLGHVRVEIAPGIKSGKGREE